MSNDLPKAYFGSPKATPVIWREEPDHDPDDEELPETPEDVVKMLGFDPAKEK